MRPTEFICTALLLAGVILMSGCQSLRPAVPPAPYGILFVDNTHNHPETGEGIPAAKQRGLDLFAYEGMAGIIEYVAWSDLEKEPGKYRFDGLVHLLQQAKEHGKKVAFGVICGSHVPAWYKEQHPDQVFHYSKVQSRQDVGAVEKPTDVVLPWVMQDRQLVLNQTYFDAFFRMMRALAAELKSQGLTEQVMYVAITGPGGGNALEVQWSIPLYKDWQRFDFTPAKQELWIAAWTRCARELERIFPSTPLALAVTDQYGAAPGSTKDKIVHARNVQLSRRVLDSVMAGQTPKTQRIYPMGLWLSYWNRWGEDAHPLCRVLQDKRDAGFRFGLQGHLIRHRDLAALERDTIGKGIEAGAIWIEIWHKDIFKNGFDDIPPKYGERFLPRPEPSPSKSTAGQWQSVPH